MTERGSKKYAASRGAFTGSNGRSGWDKNQALVGNRCFTTEGGQRPYSTIDFDSLRGVPASTEYNPRNDYSGIDRLENKGRECSFHLFL